MGLKSAEFGKLQPGEYLAMIKGHNMASKSWRAEKAYFTSCVINYIIAAHAGRKVHASKLVSAADLLKPFEPPQEKSSLLAEKESLKQIFQNYL